MWHIFLHTVTFLFIKGGNPKFDVWMHLRMVQCYMLFDITMILTSDLISSKILSVAYLLYYLK